MNQTPVYGKKTFKIKKPVIFIALALVLIIIVFLSAFSPFVTVPTGHTGVVTTFGRVEDYVLSEGFHLKSPLQEVVMMDNRTQKASIKMQAFSSDIQQVDITCTVNYSVNKEKAQHLYKNVGVNYYETVMEPRIEECAKSVFTQYTAEKLMEVRNSLSAQIKDLLEPEMEPYGILVGSIAIEDIDFTDAFTDAVEAKQVALQTKLKTETEQEELVIIAESTAEREKIAAQAQAEILKIEAQAEAEAVKLRSEAEAEANKLIAESLTEALISYMEANQWNGELPQIVGANSALPIIDVSENME
ncbi:MAG: prohibitin family protein [Clostridia bacterium]|nr:prohibitin family protein [Clostridia bacterium]